MKDFSTVCPRSNATFYVVTYFKKWVTTSWTDGNTCRGRPIVRPPAAGRSVIRPILVVGCPILIARRCGGWGPVLADRGVHLVVDDRVLLLVARRKRERRSNFYLKKE